MLQGDSNNDLKGGPGAVVPRPHSAAEDVFALLEAAILFALGVMLLKAAGLVTGSTSGLSLLISYWTGLRFGWIFAAVNLPFMIFAFFTLGRAFVFKTTCLYLLISVLTLITPDLMVMNHVHPVVAALAGGTVIGNGILVAARHNASAGGIGALALWLQKKGILRAGTFQLSIDLCVLGLSTLTLSPSQFLWSAVGMVAMNGVMIVWHRPDRYIAY